VRRKTLGAEIMLPAFVIAEVEVIDPEAFKLYGSRVAETLERYGGRYVARGGRIESLEGEPPKRVVISTWKNIEDPKRWYRSPEYSEIIGIRHRTCKSRVFVVEGLAP
jgi:uncharacterized protein (DUF1330 family)